MLIRKRGNNFVYIEEKTQINRKFRKQHIGLKFEEKAEIRPMQV